MPTCAVESVRVEAATELSNYPIHLLWISYVLWSQLASMFVNLIQESKDV